MRETRYRDKCLVLHNFLLFQIRSYDSLESKDMLKYVVLLDFYHKQHPQIYLRSRPLKNIGKDKS